MNNFHLQDIKHMHENIKHGKSERQTKSHFKLWTVCKKCSRLTTLHAEAHTKSLTFKFKLQSELSEERKPMCKYTHADNVKDRQKKKSNVKGKRRRGFETSNKKI